MTGRIKTHQPCPCGKSSDGCSYFLATKTARCHSCGDTIRNVSPPSSTPNGDIKITKNPPRKKENTSSEFTPLGLTAKSWPERGFTAETIKTYKVDLNTKKYYAKSKEDYVEGSIAKYPRFDADGNHVGNKVRIETDKGKGFVFEGDRADMTLFGMSSFEKGCAKFLTITEGQDDAMAAFQMMGSKYPVISVDSSSSAEKDIRENFEWINSFPNIVICMDSDEQGRKAAKAVSNLGFPLGKLKVLTLRKHKDANEYLLAKDGEAWTREWWQAPVVKPDGLKLGKDLWEEIIDRKESFTAPYPFEGLNALTFGIRLSELITITADTGVGKTSIIKTIEHSLLTNKEIQEKGYGVGFLHLEEPNGDTALGLLSIHNSVPYHIPGVERPEKDLRKAYDTLLNNDRVVIWDHFGSNSVDAVLDKIRHMVALGCKYIVLDHLSIVVSDQAGDERKQLDEITTKIKTLAMELDIAVIVVVHTNRQGQIRGTAGVEQLSNIVLRLQRDKTDENEWRRNVTRVSVEKNRFSGYTGPASYLWYNKETGRLSELSEEEIERFNQGGAVAEGNEPW